MKDRCIYCGAPADRWCDFVIGFEDTDGDGLYSGFEDAIYRCDSPLCAKHSRHEGIAFYPPSMGGPDTVDWCCTHPPEDRFVPVTAEEAERIRSRHRFLRSKRNLSLVTEQD